MPLLSEVQWHFFIYEFDLPLSTFDKLISIQVLMRPIRSIVVVGGGTAGYLTALTLHKKLPHINLTLIESSKVPVIGVGEATTPKLMRLLHEVLEISQDEFHKEVKPTWKLGVRFNWGKTKAKDFNFPFGMMDAHLANAITGDIDDCNLIAQLMRNDKSLVFKNDDNSPFRMLSPVRSYAYHIDNKSMVYFLRKKIQDSGIMHLDRLISKVNFDENGINSIHTDAGETLDFDMYIDCSGFHKVLSRDNKVHSFIEFKDTLFTDRAVVGKITNQGNVMPYTTATTMQCGWLWNTPMQTEDHLGYVYSSEYCTEEEAREELSTKIPGISLSPHCIKFISGRQKYFWRKNLVSIGNSYGFVEPLESTGIHMICESIIELCKALLKPELMDTDVEGVNELVGNRWDMIRWFMGIHFKYNKQVDSPFWNACNSQIDLSGVSDYIEYYKMIGPITKVYNDQLYQKMNKDSVFSAASFDFWMLVQGAPTQWEYKFDESPYEIKFRQQIGINKALTKKAIKMEMALEVVQQNPEIMKLDGWFQPTFED